MSTSSWAGSSAFAWLHGTNGYPEHWGVTNPPQVDASCSYSWPGTSCQTAYWGVCGYQGWPQGCGPSSYCSTPDACMYGTTWSYWSYSSYVWTTFSGTLSAYGNSACWNNMNCTVRIYY